MLLPASFRGVPFAVTDSATTGGRRNVVHQYPGRDDPWSEDMGRAARRFRFRGFVLDGDIMLGGLPVELQRATLIQAIEAKGPGMLVHPTLGILQVSAGEGCSISEGIGANSYSEIELEFVEAGQKLFPSTGSTSALAKLVSSTETIVGKALRVAGAIEGAIAVVSALAGGSLSGGASLCASNAISLAQDATALTRLVAQLPGNYGRYNAGANSGLTGSNSSPYSSSTTVADLIAAASADRAAVGAAAIAFESAVASASTSDASGVPSAAFAMIDAIAACCADPADAVRILLDLIAWCAATDQSPALTTTIARGAAAALTDAVADYQPASSTDAAQRIDTIGAVLDALALAAADAGEDDVWAAISACRAAVVEQLRAAGATLPQLRTFVLPSSLPALALAQQLYGDATRADQLIQQVDPPHPLFMPTSFQALAA